MMKKTLLILLLTVVGLGASAVTRALDMVTVKTISMDLALEIAQKTVLACREQGYQVSAVVVDRNANLVVALRDTLAARFTLQIAEEKANTSIFSGMKTGEFRASRGDIQQELNHVEGIIVMEGGLLIEAGGSRLGAVGVSGAPGGDKDEACAAKALEAVEERLEFAD